MGEKQRVEKAQAASLKIGGSFTHPVCGGQASVTTAGTVTAPLKSITSVIVCLGQTPATGASLATATWSGNVITIKVWTDVAVASTVATVVNWIAVGK